MTTAINHAAGGDAIAIDDETEALLRYAGQCHTVGWSDSTSRPACCAAPGIFAAIRRAFRRERDRCPAADDRLGQSMPATGRVRLAHAGMQIDLGGIGKEYAADRAATCSAAHGIDPRAGEPGWRRCARSVHRREGARGGSGSIHPRQPEAAIAVDRAFRRRRRESGDYERYFMHEGRAAVTSSTRRTGRLQAAAKSISVRRTRSCMREAARRLRCCLRGLGPFLDSQRVAWLGVDAERIRSAV